MQDSNNIPLSCAAIAFTLWAVGILLVLLETILEMTPLGINDARFWSGVGKLGLVACMGGATLTVRGFACRAVRSVLQEQAGRERDVFEMGVDYGRQGDVRSLR